MESKDIIRLQRDLTTNALNLMGEGDKKRYDGLSDGYRRWEKAIVNTFNSIGLNHLERFFKHMASSLVLCVPVAARMSASRSLAQHATIDNLERGYTQVGAVALDEPVGAATAYWNG